MTAGQVSASWGLGEPYASAARTFAARGRRESPAGVTDQRFADLMVERGWATVQPDGSLTITEKGRAEL